MESPGASRPPAIPRFRKKARVAQPTLDVPTFFRCGGCGVTARFAHAEQQYGRLVHAFLDQHGHCGDAVQITSARPPVQRTRPGHDSTLWG
jgi:hypothetical protein